MGKKQATKKRDEDLEQWIVEHLAEGFESGAVATLEELVDDHGDTTEAAVRASVAHLVADGFVRQEGESVVLVRKPGESPDAPTSGPLDADDHANTPTRNLKCILTAEELTAKAALLDENFAELDKAHVELDRLARDTKAAKGQIEALHGANASIARTRRDGYEWRDVPCIERRNEEALQIETVRVDTGEVVDTRAMSASDRQGNLWESTDAAAAQ